MADKEPETGDTEPETGTSEQEKFTADAAAARVAALEAEQAAAKAEADKAIEQAKTEAAATVADTKAGAEAEVTDWRNEAEKWKAQSQNQEKRAKENAAAAVELERIHALAAANREEREAATEDLTNKAAEAEQEVARLKVAQELGVPAELTQFLTGESTAEIEEQAERLLARIDLNRSENGDTETEAEPDPAAVELAEAKEKLSKAETEALRYKVANKHGLPGELASFLSADTEAALEEQAALLMSAAGAEAEGPGVRGKMPRRNLRSGAVPEGVEAEPDPIQLADSIRRQERGY